MTTPSPPESFKNKLSWSVTRDAVFRTCSRRYWYEYYASWGGWDEGASPLTREIYRLKKLKTRMMWSGDLVHRAVKRSLTNLTRGVAVLGVDRIVEITLNLMRNEFRSSHRGHDRHAGSTRLFEHEYNIPVSDEEWQSVASGLETCLRHFYASDLFGRLRGLSRGSILEVETLSSFDLGGTRCWVVLDAAWRTDTGLTVADWKTGRQEMGGYELQMTGYALYAAERWGANIEDLELIEYNLFLDRTHRYQADRATAERTRSYIRGSIDDMRSMLADPGENIPLPDERFVRVRKREVCSRCNYLKVCLPFPGEPLVSRND